MKYVLAHAPGTGKTLAAIAPLVQLLWDWEAESGRTPKGEVPRARLAKGRGGADCDRGAALQP